MKTAGQTIEAVGGAYRCIRCNYGISVTRVPARCPMCGGGTWAKTRAAR